jgi:hypothetical protein
METESRPDHGTQSTQRLKEISECSVFPDVNLHFIPGPFSTPLTVSAPHPPAPSPEGEGEGGVFPLSLRRGGQGVRWLEARGTNREDRGNS